MEQDQVDDAVGDAVDRILYQIEAGEKQYQAPALPTRDDMTYFEKSAFDAMPAVKDKYDDTEVETVKKKKFPAVVRPIPLKITVVGARNLRNADILNGTGTSDSFCICEIPGKHRSRFQTPVMTDCVNPVWNHLADLNFNLGDSLKFTLYDKDWAAKELLGDVTLKASQFYPAGFSGELELENNGKTLKEIKSLNDVKAFLKIKIEVCKLSKRPMLERSFTVSQRPPIYSRIDNTLGPGTYDTHKVGTYAYDKNSEVSHPAQKTITNHKSMPLLGFGKPENVEKKMARQTSLGQAPGPGHYAKPDLWDPLWQKYPPKGTSFARQPPVPGESRFGSLARGLVKGAKGMDFGGIS